MVDALGNPINLLISAGNEADISHAEPLFEPILQTLSINGTIVNADKGYDSKAFVDFLESHGAIANVPSRKSNKVQRECDWWMYKERYLVECFWNKIKQFRRVATRYEKLAKTFLGVVYLAAILVLVK